MLVALSTGDKNKDDLVGKMSDHDIFTLRNKLMLFIMALSNAKEMMGLPHSKTWKHCCDEAIKAAKVIGMYIILMDVRIKTISKV